MPGPPLLISAHENDQTPGSRQKQNCRPSPARKARDSPPNLRARERPDTRGSPELPALARAKKARASPSNLSARERPYTRGPPELPALARAKGPGLPF